MTFGATPATVTMVVQDYFERQSVSDPTYDNHVALIPSDFSKQQNVYAFMPTHQTLWTTEHIDEQPAREDVYVDWNTDHVSLWFTIPCETTIQWTIPQLGHSGSLSANNTWNTLSLPRHPYLSSFDFELTCDQEILRHHIAKDRSPRIPKISWQYSDQTSLLVQEAVGYTLLIQQRIENSWQTIDIKHPVHNLEHWLLPPTDAPMRIQVSNGQRVIKESSIPPPFPTPIIDTTWDATQTTLQAYLSGHHPLSGTLYGPDTTLSSLSTQPNTLLFSGVQQGLYWLKLQESLQQSVQAVWAYDGPWDWFAYPVWQGDPVVEHSVVTYPQFLRWGDQINIEIHTPDCPQIEQKTIYGSPTNPDQMVNLHWSPEDRLLYDFQTQTVFNETLTTPLHSLIDQQGLLRVDAQISDKRLLDLLLELHQPLSPMSAATILHHGSLFWDALQDRNLTWYAETQRHILKSQSYLENMSLDTWQQLDFHTQIFIVWASLIAEQQGMTPASQWMRQNTDWLCNLSGTDIPEDAAIIAHLRWLLQNSMWKHRSCTVGVTTPFDQHPVTKHQMAHLQQELDLALREKQTLTLNSQPRWLHWNLMENERTIRDRYTNLHVSVNDDDTAPKGLFHEWQHRPLQTTLPVEEQTTLTVRGVGRIYTSLWYPLIEQLNVTDHDTLRIHREIQQSGSIISPTDLRVGQPIQIVTTVTTAPQETICLQSFGAAGLTNSIPFQSTCTKTDQNGHWTAIEEHVVQFGGRFRLPATFVATEMHIAHSESLWLQAIYP